MVVEVTSEPVLPVLFEPGDWMGVRALGAKGVRALASKIVRAMMRSMGVRSMGSICVRAMGVRVLTGSFFAFFLVSFNARPMSNPRLIYFLSLILFS